MPDAELLDPLALLVRRRVTCRIVRMHDDQGARLRSDPALQLGEVDPPAEVVEQRVRLKPNVVEVREVVEQRIARLRHHHRISRIAEQTEQEAVCLARAGRQDYLLRINRRDVLRIIRRNSLSSRQNPSRRRIVGHRPTVPQRPENRIRIVPKPAHSRVRHGEIDQLPPARPSLAHRPRQGILTRIPTRPSGEPAAHPSSLRFPYNHSMSRPGMSPPITAVLFDYGLVLSGPPDPVAWSQMLAITGLDDPTFHAAYWALRRDYDRGALSGPDYWRAVGEHAGLELTEHQSDALIAADTALWTTLNQPMVDWALRLQAAGTKTAILSNLGDSMMDGVLAAFPWLAGFDHLLWSHTLRLAKPDPEIYRRAAEGLRTPPQNILFIDDRDENIAGGRAAGMQIICYSSHEDFIRQMDSRGLGRLLHTGRAD